MQDGLFINNVWVSEINFSLTFAGNDITQPDARTASYSNSFTLPDSLTVRDLLQGGEQLDAGGVHPYRQLPAKVIDNGETIFSGIVEFVSFSSGWKVNLLDSLIDFFDAIKDKPLTDLNLDRLNHPWTLDQITAYAGSDSDIVYPLVDNGGIDSGIVPYDTMCPAVYAKTLFGQICKEAGYKPIGDWLADPLFKKLAVPFVGAEPKAHDQEWVEDRSARVTVVEADPIHLEDGHPIDVVLPLVADNLPLDDFFNGKVKPFKTDRYTYVCPSSMRVKVAAQVLFTSIVRFGAADIRLILQRNGQNVANVYYSKAGYHDGLDIPETLHLEESVDCLKDDELTIRLTGSARTDLADYSYYFSLIPGDSYASFTPDSLVHLGDLWPVAQNLPADITCSDLALSIAKIFQGTYVVDSLHKTVKLVPLDDVIANVPNAKDWSKNTDESVQPELTVQFEGYSAKNWYKWREHEDKASIGYGDGYVTCGNTANSKESTLFELPFMACIDSASTVGGYGNPIHIKTRSISKSGDTISVSKNDTAARLILIEPTKTVVVQTNTLTPSGDIVKVPVTLTACWWAKRPAGARTANNAFSLAFTGVLGQMEESLITRYFTATKRILRRPRMLNASVYLHPSDIATLDLSVPIRLKGVRLGSLDINDNLFYLNKLGPYRSGKVCNATLIAL